MKPITYLTYLATLLTLAVHIPSARAQSALPTLSLRGASGFEGNSGATTFHFVAELDHRTLTPVSGTVVLAGVAALASGQAAATPGTAPGPGVDFIRPNGETFTIPAGQLSVTIPITVLGDTAIEPQELFAIAVQNVTGARASSTAFLAVGIIHNDDGPPTLTIDDVAATEPFGRLSQRVVKFPVRLSHPAPLPVAVAWSTPGVTATPDADYLGLGGLLGVLNIPAGGLSGEIPVTILGDILTEPSETFRVVLHPEVIVGLPNTPQGTVIIPDTIAIGTIHDFQLVTGAFDFAPDHASVPPEETKIFTVLWTVPEGETWRDLRTIDLCLHDGRHAALWVRWEESANTFSLAETRGKRHDHRRRGPHHDDDACDDLIAFGPGAAPGSDTVLETRDARLHLAQSAAIGSGPDGLTVELRLALSFPRKSAGRSFRADLAASDDAGHTDAFTRAGTVHVQRKKPR